MLPSKDDAKYYFRAHLLASIWQTCYVRSIRQIGDFRSRTDFAAVGWRLQPPFVICSLACSEMILKWSFTSSGHLCSTFKSAGEMISVEVDLGIWLTPWEQHYNNAKSPLGFLVYTLNKASGSAGRRILLCRQLEIMSTSSSSGMVNTYAT